jgi:hypothetical protein
MNLLIGIEKITLIKANQPERLFGFIIKKTMNQ